MEEYNIGKRIAEFRKGMGLTQVELANRLNVSDKTISKWENGGGLPEITSLLPLAKIFGVSTDYLLSGKTNSNDIRQYKEKLLKECIEGEIINIYKLLKINDTAYIKKGFYNYPIHIIEIFYNMIKKEDWKGLYKYAVDYGKRTLIECFVNGKLEFLEKIIMSEYWYKDDSKYREKLYRMDKMNVENIDYIFSEEKCPKYPHCTFEEVVSHLDYCKKNLISIYQDKEKYLISHDENYCLKDLKEGFLEEAIRKLGERLEYVLSIKYMKERNKDSLKGKLSNYLLENGYKVDYYNRGQNEEFVNDMIKFVECYEELQKIGKINNNMLVYKIRKCAEFILSIK